MAKPTVGLPQGTRDFGPEIVRKRNHIFNTIKKQFELCGYQPLETPAMENLDTLMGKYGEEGDKLIFKILNNGLDNPAKETAARRDFEHVLQGRNVKGITERALKYDLTIPFARYVAMNQGQLLFPFKRYQVQPVWRADRPQKGRYREFYQCDADVVGSVSLWNEVELAGIYARVFNNLGLSIEIRINSRKILAALAAICGSEEQLTAITVAIDKLDKTGIEKVKEELAEKNLNPRQIGIIERYLSIKGENAEKLEKLKQLLSGNKEGEKGMEEIEFLLSKFRLSSGSSATGTSCSLVFDPTLARGLNYYTGIIFEVKSTEVQMGSIGGGGRYDDLTGLFGVPGIPGVGISFGVDRIYDVLEELKRFPADLKTGTQVLFFNLGEKESEAAFTLLQQVRERGISGELYPENTKFDKQFKYADKKNIPYVVIIGEEELKSGSCKVKDTRSGEQQNLTAETVSREFPFI